MVGVVREVISAGILPLQMVCVPDMVPAVIGFSVAMIVALVVHP